MSVTSRSLLVSFLGVFLSIQVSYGASSPDWQDNPVAVFGPETVKVVGDRDGDHDDDLPGQFDSKTFTITNPKFTYALQVQNHGAKNARVILEGQDSLWEIRDFWSLWSYWCENELVDKHFVFKSADEKVLIPVSLARKIKIRIVAHGKSGGLITVQVLGPADLLPPSPSSVAPTPNPGVPASNFGAGVSFLYTGTNPIQTGVASNTISEDRVSVIRGQALDVSLKPLSNAVVKVLNHPEFGQTLTRLDGMFDMAVNGDQLLTVEITKSGYVVLHR